MTRPAHVAGLDAGTPLWTAAERLLHARLADVREAEARAARRLDVRTVHDLRVACRRLRAAVKLFGKKRLRTLDARIEYLQDALGEVRDLQLEARWLERHRADAGRPSVRLRKAEAHLRRALALWTRRSEPELLRRLSYVRRRGALGGPRMRKRLRQRVRQLEGAFAQPDPFEAAAAHRIRIAAKKLRYDAELLSDGFELSAAIDALSELQGVLGSLHDADLRLETIRANPRLARAARAERQRCTTRAKALSARAKKLCSKLRQEGL